MNLIVHIGHACRKKKNIGKMRAVFILLKNISIAKIHQFNSIIKSVLGPKPREQDTPSRDHIYLSSIDERKAVVEPEFSAEGIVFGEAYS